MKDRIKARLRCLGCKVSRTAGTLEEPMISATRSRRIKAYGGSRFPAGFLTHYEGMSWA